MLGIGMAYKRLRVGYHAPPLPNPVGYGSMRVALQALMIDHTFATRNSCISTTGSSEQTLRLLSLSDNHGDHHEHTIKRPQVGILT